MSKPPASCEVKSERKAGHQRTAGHWFVSMAASECWKGPEAIDLYCGKCGVVLYSALRRDCYVFSPPSEAHVEYELHTDVEPVRCNTATLGANPAELSCLHRCMAWKNVFLIKERATAGSGMPRFSIACGRDLVKCKEAALGVWRTASSYSLATPSPTTVPGREVGTARISPSVLSEVPPGVDLEASRVFFAQESLRQQRRESSAKRYDLQRVELQDGICGGFVGVTVRRRIVVERDELSDELRVLVGVGGSAVKFHASLSWDRFDALSVALESLFTFPTECPVACDDIYGINVGISVEARDKRGLRLLKKWRNRGPSGCCRSSSSSQPNLQQRAHFKELAAMIAAIADAPTRL